MNNKWIYIRSHIEPDILKAAFELILGADFVSLEVTETQMIIVVAAHVQQAFIDDVIERNEEDLRNMVTQAARTQLMQQVEAIKTVADVKQFLEQWLIPLMTGEE